MMTLFSRWLLYISSYFLGYILIAIADVIKVTQSLSDDQIYISLSPIDKVPYVFGKDCVLFSVLITLTFISIVWIFYFKKWRNNRRIKEYMRKDSSIDAAGFMISYIVSMVCITIDFYGVVVMVILFFTLGFVFVGNDNLHTSPTFFLLGYRIYSNESCYVITKMTREQYNLKLQDEPDGIEARELAKGVFFVIDN